MDELDRFATRDGECGWSMRFGQSGGREVRLELPEWRQRRFGLTLESALDDEGRLAMADKDERGIQAIGDHTARDAGQRTGPIVNAAARAGSSTGRGPPPAS